MIKIDVLCSSTVSPQSFLEAEMTIPVLPSSNTTLQCFSILYSSKSVYSEKVVTAKEQRTTEKLQKVCCECFLSCLMLNIAKNCLMIRLTNISDIDYCRWGIFLRCIFVWVHWERETRVKNLIFRALKWNTSWPEHGFSDASAKSSPPT